MPFFVINPLPLGPSPKCRATRSNSVRSLQDAGCSRRSLQSKPAPRQFSIQDHKNTSAAPPTPPFQPKSTYSKIETGPSHTFPITGADRRAPPDGPGSDVGSWMFNVGCSPCSAMHCLRPSALSLQSQKYQCSASNPSISTKINLSNIETDPSHTFPITAAHRRPKPPFRGWMLDVQCWMFSLLRHAPPSPFNLQDHKNTNPAPPTPPFQPKSTYSNIETGSSHTFPITVRASTCPWERRRPVRLNNKAAGHFSAS